MAEEGDLVQITTRRLEAPRVPRGVEAVFETRLAENEQIVGVSFAFSLDHERRATVDHFLHVYVATRIVPEPEDQLL